MTALFEDRIPAASSARRSSASVNPPSPIAPAVKTAVG